MQIERNTLAAIDHVQHGCGGRFVRHLLGTLLRTAFAVEHIGTGNLMVTTAHQSQFYLVLYIFNMKSTATGA